MALKVTLMYNAIANSLFEKEHFETTGQWQNRIKITLTGTVSTNSNAQHASALPFPFYC